MSIRSNVIIAMALGLAISSSVYASDGQQGPGQGNMPQRPDFSSIDSNSDNEISESELSAMGGPSDGPDISEVFSAMDSNSDGSISESEFNNFEPPRPSRQQN